MRRQLAASLGLAGLLSIIHVLAAGPAALAQTPPDCTPYLDIVRSSSAAATAIIPDRLLANAGSATTCLIRAVASLKPVAETAHLSPDARSQFLSATNGLRTLISKANAEDAKAGQTSGDGPALRDFIGKFRTNDNLDVISVLTFGARSDTYEVRSNALLILANVIDNTSVCVPLDHFSDSSLGKSDPASGADYPIKGRANLLAVISVVAPWAYKENYNFIQDVANKMEAIDKTDPNFSQTVKILQNLQSRLASQTNDTNKNVDLKDLRKGCVAYKPKFTKPWPYR